MTVGQIRARKAHAKEQRAAEFLAAAHRLVAERGWRGFTMADVAQRVGLAKGTLFLYFPTKEGLGVALVQQLLAEWFDDFDQRLGRVRAPASALRVARQMADSIVPRKELVALLAMLGNILEYNVDAATAERFKSWLLQRMVLTGALLEKVLPFLPSNGGTRLLVHLHALVVGLHQHAEPAPVVAQVLMTPALQPLRIDFGQELVFSARALIEGLRAMHSEEEQ